MRGINEITDRKWYSYLDQDKSEIEKFSIKYKDQKLIVAQGVTDALTERKDSIHYLKIDPNHFETTRNMNDIKSFKYDLYGDLKSFSKLKIPSQIPRYHEGRTDFVAPIDWQINH